MNNKAISNYLSRKITFDVFRIIPFIRIKIP